MLTKEKHGAQVQVEGGDNLNHIGDVDEGKIGTCEARETIKVTVPDTDGLMRVNVRRPFLG